MRIKTKPIPKNSRFSVVKTGDQTGIAQANWTLVTFDSVLFDKLGEYSTGTHKFTAKRTGYYLFTAKAGWANPSSNQFYILQLVIHDFAAVVTTQAVAPSTVPFDQQLVSLVYLVAGWTVYVQVFHSATENQTLAGATTMFQAHLLSEED